MNAILRYGFGLLALVGLMSAQPVLAAKAPRTAAHLYIEDGGHMFSDTAKEKAKSRVAESMGEGDREIHIETYEKLSDSERKDFEAAGKDKTEFWKNWSNGKIRGDRGLVVLICRSPGHVIVRADKQFKDHGFTSDKEQKLDSILLSGFREAAKAKEEGKSESAQQDIKNAALLSGADYIKAEIPTSVLDHAAKATSSGGSSIMTYVCIGVVALVALWLVFGLIRAFTGGGGGGAGGGMGGGGGGGFGTSLLGGLFGAMAGMWLYNNLLGGGMSSAMGGDNFNSGDGGTESGGAGDFSGDQGAGGDFGDSGGSGGDFGGGDTGGGDWGGGGGDFGGGGGDF